ncbi:MAG TPA: quinolinate synthase NadA [Candidatus Hydrogenedentes bacterium]|nr:quinolinate synthase NadA [Candidatus Hydrogenedentota bacterium]HQE83951.1 quinolinate synthase NadA [Candidatus Hydrogenedentota bacterium]HQH51797.1 quinolinate synthase NadA [Candidatus Hydrogenedentota bacterium]HQM48384.1 quinolinate synthase NadA [Candidatus Hydrogenedentota bacterium]
MTRIFAAQDTQTFEELLEAMRVKLRRLIPDVEIRAKARLAFEINTLKRRLNAIILGHNYMEPALYCSVPDNVGDSLQLARFSAQSNADIIVFCGVKFMAETAKILNPDRMVLIPSLEAGCSLAEGISGDDVKALKRRFPGAPVVSYVNTHAETKAASDYCCTSGNSEAVLRYLLDKGHKHIIFVPDEFLARNTARELGVAFIEGWIPGTEKDLRADTPAVIGWGAHCEVHELFEAEDVDAVKRQFPEAITIAHPECKPGVIEKVDVTGSTKKMVDYVQASHANQFMLFTECSMADNLAAENPDKEMIRLCSHQCPHMALITLEQTLASLQNLQYQVELPEEIIRNAKAPIDNMLAIS